MTILLLSLALIAQSPEVPHKHKPVPQEPTYPNSLHPSVPLPPPKVMPSPQSPTVEPIPVVTIPCPTVQTWAIVRECSPVTVVKVKVKRRLFGGLFRGCGG